jgi:microcystin-dependent protein
VSSPYIGEIRIFGGSFAPAGWAFCAGQLMPISENDALFTLIGTTYGGDGQETFGIPDLRGRVPIHMGQLSGGGQTFQIGENAGTESVTLTVQQIPAHTHPMLASTNPGVSASAQGNIICSSPSINLYIEGQAPDTPLNNQVVTPVGGSQPHENMQPYLTISYIISLFGIFPTQN